MYNSKTVTKSQFEELYLVQNLTGTQIGVLFNRTKAWADWKRQSLGINSVLPYQRHPKQELSLKEKAFVVGSLLGDGSLIGRERANVRLSICQSTIHEEYLLWLYNEMKNWHTSTKYLNYFDEFDHRTSKIYHKVRFHTIQHPVFNEFSKAFYLIDGTKILNIEFISKYFTDYSFAILIMDDGNNDQGSIRLCTEGFLESDLLLFRDFLCQKYDLHSWIVKRTVSTATDQRYRIEFSKKSTIKISNIVAPYFVPSMKYKLSF